MFLLYVARNKCPLDAGKNVKSVFLPWKKKKSGYPTNNLTVSFSGL